tara:strand:- start:3004 stop:3429 length:426 start_codon:yes stop_codon:yes gene_type:complete
MKKLILLSSLFLSLVLSSQPVNANKLPDYSYVVSITQEKTLVASGSGFLTPVDKNEPYTVTVNDVAKKLKYGFSSISSTTGDYRLSILMYMTDDNEYIFDSSVTGCGVFTYKSLGVPDSDTLELDGDNNCKLKLNFYEMKR